MNHMQFFIKQESFSPFFLEAISLTTKFSVPPHLQQLAQLSYSIDCPIIETNPLKFKGYGMAIFNICRVLEDADPHALLEVSDFIIRDKRVCSVIEAIHAILDSSAANKCTVPQQHDGLYHPSHHIFPITSPLLSPASMTRLRWRASPRSSYVLGYALSHCISYFWRRKCGPNACRKSQNTCSSFAEARQRSKDPQRKSVKIGVIFALTRLSTQKERENRTPHGALPSGTGNTKMESSIRSKIPEIRADHDYNHASLTPLTGL